MDITMNNQIAKLSEFDAEIGAVVAEELERQRHGLELIASKTLFPRLLCWQWVLP